jgi:hypothetical protein
MIASKIHSLTKGNNRDTTGFKNAICRWSIRLQDDYGVELDQDQQGNLLLTLPGGFALALE